VKLGSAKLLSGLPVEVFIKMQRRPALSYFLKPPHDQAGRVFKER
jgi:HlyD family secretion protein